MDRREDSRRVRYSAGGAVFQGQENQVSKTNQDQFLIRKMKVGEVECGLFCIFDGHGPHGHRVSSFMSKRFPGGMKRACRSDAGRGRDEQDEVDPRIRTGLHSLGRRDYGKQRTQPHDQRKHLRGGAHFSRSNLLRECWRFAGGPGETSR